jgi:hypothetical protein
MLPAGLKAREVRGWRAEKRKPVAPHPLPDTAGASRRAMSGDFIDAGPRCRPLPRWGSSLRDLADERGDSQRLVWTLRSSASSWQGLIMDPGGAPAPPGCRLHVKPARRRRTSPRITTPREAPLADEVGSRIEEVWSAGISWAQPSHSPMNSHRISRQR